MSEKKTILLVDEDSDVIDLLEPRCRGIGLRVKTAHNALAAVKLMDRAMPDVICLDVNMPTGNGLAICETLATDAATVGIPVIVMSASWSPATIEKCGDLAVYFVHKSGDLWKRIEPVLYELVDIDAVSDDSPLQHRAY